MTYVTMYLYMSSQPGIIATYGAFIFVTPEPRPPEIRPIYGQLAPVVQKFKRPPYPVTRAPWTDPSRDCYESQPPASQSPWELGVVWSSSGPVAAGTMLSGEWFRLTMCGIPIYRYIPISK